jgi:hypothetical protein
MTRYMKNSMKEIYWHRQVGCEMPIKKKNYIKRKCKVFGRT